MDHLAVCYMNEWSSEVPVECNSLPSHDPHKWRMEVARLGAEDLHIGGGPGGGRNVSLSGWIGKQLHLTLAGDKCWQKLTDGLRWTAEQTCKR